MWNQVRKEPNENPSLGKVSYFFHIDSVESILLLLEKKLLGIWNSYGLGSEKTHCKLSSFQWPNPITIQVEGLSSTRNL